MIKTGREILTAVFGAGAVALMEGQEYSWLVGSAYAAATFDYPTSCALGMLWHGAHPGPRTRKFPYPAEFSQDLERYYGPRTPQHVLYTPAGILLDQIMRANDRGEFRRAGSLSRWLDEYRTLTEEA